MGYDISLLLSALVPYVFCMFAGIYFVPTVQAFRALVRYIASGYNAPPSIPIG